MAIACPRCGVQNDNGTRACLNCGANLGGPPPAELSDPRVGTEILGRYRILRVLADGGMGRVYLADQVMGMGVRRVAIKTLHVDLRADPQAISRFQQECKTVCDLEHPNTIKFHDFGKLDDGALFIVMEYVEGESLGAVARRGPMPVERLDPILVQLSGSLSEAHHKGIIHRDLKPDNVLLTNRAGQTDFVKVLDFGIAKRNDVASTGAPLTVQGTMLGTPPYMSPEQFRGEPLDGRSDLYSLGVIAFELLTGELPFAANTPWEWATKHLTEAPRSLDQFPAAAGLPAHRKEAVHRALAKSREERFASVNEFARAFTGIQNPSAAWAMATGGNSLRPQATAALPTPATMAIAQPSIPVPTPAPSYTPPYAPGGSSGTMVAMPPTPYVSQHPPPAGPTPTRGGRAWMVALPLAVVLGGGGVFFALRPDDPRPDVTPSAPAPVPTTIVVPAPTLPERQTPPAPTPPVPALPTAPSQWLGIMHHRGSAVDAAHALGAADGQYAIIPPRTFTTLQTAAGWQFVSDGTLAPDLEIFVDGARSAAYSVEVGSSGGHNAFVMAMASARGRVSIDLDAVGVTATQLVRIRNLGGEGVYLDAIMAQHAIRGGRPVE